MRKIVLLFLCLAIMSCNKDNYCNDINGHNEITFFNASSKIINFEFYWNYPDTVIGEYNPVFDGTGGLYPNKFSYRGAGPGGCWEETLIDSTNEWIYIFDQDTIKNLDWNVVRATNRGLLERRLIDLEYLQANNFVMTYP